MSNVALENRAIHTCRQVISNSWQHIFATSGITDNSHISNKSRERGYLFPLYLYPDTSNLFDTGVRRPNLSPEFIAAFAEKVGLEFTNDGKGDLERTFGPEDVFHYIYAVFHAPSYRERYAEFLKIDFPRVPLTNNLELFCTLTVYGETLVALHLMERVGSPISSYPVDGDNIVDKVSFTEEYVRRGASISTRRSILTACRFRSGTFTSAGIRCVKSGSKTVKAARSRMTIYGTTALSSRRCLKLSAL